LMLTQIEPTKSQVTTTNAVEDNMFPVASFLGKAVITIAV
jgi:hypothetical protein